MFSIGSAILHFVIGGIAVALASIIADKVGGKLGGIIATMPAVFLAAIIALALDHRGTQLVEMSMNLSTGAIVGILSCILTVFLTSLYIKHKGYRKGAIFTVVCWFVISLAILISEIQVGIEKITSA
ncbi:DUF3147 family protein [Staphylococcus aureus]|nr:DUF3147 family protein [Staphylococcus aureus]